MLTYNHTLTPLLRIITYEWAFLILVSTPSCSNHSPAETDELRPEVRAHARKLAQASDPYKAAIASTALFELATDKEVAELRKDSDDGIALRAAWEVLRRAFPNNNQEPSDMDARQLHRFLGFTEGRLRVSVPDWWEQAVLSAQIGGTFLPEKAMPYGKTGLGFMSPGGVSVQSGVDMATISEAQRSVAVPVSFLRGNQKARRHEGIEDRITATITDQGCYVAFHDSVESPYTLYRLDRATGMVLWSTNVSAGGYTGGTGTGYKHAVGLLPRENTVWVFGVGIYAVYVEKFSAENGKSQFRFTTAY